ncbi:MAG: hypothetical protein AAB368_03120, partial [bacterium]
GAGILFIADSGIHRIRRVDAGTGEISTVAGSGVFGDSGDGGPATDAQLNTPMGVAVDGSGNLFIADYLNHRVRRVDMGTGDITRFAGTGAMGYGGDGQPATDATMDRPWAIDLDGAGNVFISDSNNNRIRRVDAGTGQINTVAGNGSPGFGGDGGPSDSAMLALPIGVALDSLCRLVIGEQDNQRVRRVAIGVSGDAWDPGDDNSIGATPLWPTFAQQFHGPHTLGGADTTDWFFFYLNAGESLRFNLGLCPRMRIYSNPSGGSLQEQWCGLTFSAQTSGTYYLSLGDTSGAYTLEYHKETLASGLRTSRMAPTEGMPFQVLFSVTNAGASTLTVVTPFLWSGTPGMAVQQSGPTPASVTLTPGQTQTFMWGFLAGSATGYLSLSASATGMSGTVMFGTESSWSTDVTPVDAWDPGDDISSGASVLVPTPLPQAPG